MDNLQPVIDRVLLHVHNYYFVQNHSLSFDKELIMDCVYSLKINGREVTRCVFGCLLGPDPIPERWEGENISSLLARFRGPVNYSGKIGSIVKQRLIDQGFWPETDEHVETYIRVLQRLQYMHDEAAELDDKNIFEKHMRVMFQEAGLKWPGDIK